MDMKGRLFFEKRQATKKKVDTVVNDSYTKLSMPCFTKYTINIFYIFTF
jgi:hypothetical protein